MDDDRARARTLFLPLREAGSVWCATLALFAYYASSMARDLSLYDSGELALAAVDLGLGHPPGQPLHTLLGFLLSRLPFVPALVGVGLCSVLPGALSLVPACSIAQALSGSSTPRAVLRVMPWLLALGALHASLWETATRVEVYALSAFLALWAVARLSPTTTQRSARDLLLAGIALGLSASVNPLVALCTGLALAPALLRDLVRKELPLRALFAAVLGGVLGMLPYAYLPLVAARRDVMIWGAPRDLPSFIRYVSLSDYVSVHEVTFGTFASHMLGWVTWGTEHMLAPMVLLGVVGHAVLGSRTRAGRWTLPVLLLLLLSKTAYQGEWNLDVPDLISYLSTPLWLALAGVTAYTAHAYAEGRTRGAAIFVAAIVLSSMTAAPHVFARTRALDHLARELAEQVLREAPAHAIVITEVDHIAGALFYLQDAEHARPDVVVLAYGLGSSSWHWERIYEQHPELAAISLRGPGGKIGRVQRFLAANATRTLLIERAGTAAELGVRACPVGLYLRTGHACDAHAAADLRVAEYFRRTLDRLGAGSPGADGAIAQATFALGESFWRAGDARAAYLTYLSGVPRSMLPSSLSDASTADKLGSAAALATATPGFSRKTALGDPARNLFMLGLLLANASQTQAAHDAFAAAAADGLPEAMRMLSNAR